MTIKYDIEKDSLYLKGFQIGFEQGLTKSILVCHKNGIKPKEIAIEFGLSLKKVLQIIQSTDKATI